jgi:hypothetical protein
LRHPPCCRCTLHPSCLRRFRAGVINDANDASYNLTITGNDFIGGWTTATRPSLADVVVAVSLSATALPAGPADRNWVIENNDINGVQQGIEINYLAGSTANTVGISIRNNQILANLCSIFRRCYNVINRSPEDVNVRENW